MSKRKRKQKRKQVAFVPTDQVVCHDVKYNGKRDMRYVLPLDGFDKLVALERRGHFIYIHPNFTG